MAAQPALAARLPLAEPRPGPTTPSEKVRLFRSLFRGREDVFPIRFVSKKTGKPGYGVFGWRNAVQCNHIVVDLWSLQCRRAKWKRLGFASLRPI